MAADAYDVTKDRWPVSVAENWGFRQAFVVTTSDTLDVTSSNAANTDPAQFYAKALYIGVSGDVAVIAAQDKSNGGAGTARIFKAHPVGYMPGQVRRVMATGTTATNILALTD